MALVAEVGGYKAQQKYTHDVRTRENRQGRVVIRTKNTAGGYLFLRVHCDI